MSEAIRHLVFPVVAMRGVVSAYPKPLEGVINEPQETNYPHPEIALANHEVVMWEMMQREVSFREIYLGVPPSKATALAFHASFTDVHTMPINVHIDHDKAKAFVSAVFLHHESSGRSTAPWEMFGYALDVTNNNLAEAIKILAVTTRHMARAQDFRLFPLEINEGTMREWRKAVAVEIGTKINDPAGDIYHFFGGMLVGISRESRKGGTYNTATGKLTDVIMTNVDTATDVLRYKLARKSGGTHETDLLGYEVGRALVYSLAQDG